jgi:hypothetical protein
MLAPRRFARRERVGGTPLRAGHVRPRQGVARREHRLGYWLAEVLERREDDVLGLPPSQAVQTGLRVL